MIIASGTTVNAGASGARQNFGLGNGDTSAYQALSLTVGGTMNCLQFFTFYASNAAGNTQTASITINSGGTVNSSSDNFGITARDD